MNEVIDGKEKRALDSNFQVGDRVVYHSRECRILAVKFDEQHVIYVIDTPDSIVPGVHAGEIIAA